MPFNIFLKWDVPLMITKIKGALQFLSKIKYIERLISGT